jgi:hypothetical protein
LQAPYSQVFLYLLETGGEFLAGCRDKRIKRSLAEPLPHPILMFDNDIEVSYRELARTLEAAVTSRAGAASI